MSDNLDPDIRDRVRLTNPEQLYQIKDETGQVVDLEQADGRRLFNHYRHNMTNYDRVLDDIRAEQGYVTGRQEKKASAGAAEQILEKYRDEHVKVIKNGQTNKHILKTLMQKAGVGTASALVNFLDSCSSKIKEISQLEDSQRALRSWNDTYRVQRELTKRLLLEKGVAEDIITQINAIYGTRSVNKAVELASNLLDLEKSEILKLIKTAVRYTKLKSGEK